MDDENKNTMINGNENDNLLNEAKTKIFDEFLKNTYGKKSIDKMSLLNKIKQMKEKGKNKVNDHQIVQILNFISRKRNV